MESTQSIYRNKRIHMYNYEALNKAVIKGKVDSVTDLTRKALEEKKPVKEILENGLTIAMEVVGQKYQSGEFYLTEMIVAARAMHAGLDLLRPYLIGDDSSFKGKAVIGTVKGDNHDIGKNILKAMFEGVGFEVIDLGINVGAEQFVKAVREHNPIFVLMSALLTTTMIYMADVIEAFEETNIRNDIWIGVGGAPVNQAFADEIGADLYALNAADAVDLAKKFMAKN
jgi:5-methyltetrahydrofolate--homocysteine methyltransferase